MSSYAYVGGASAPSGTISNPYQMAPQSFLIPQQRAPNPFHHTDAMHPPPPPQEATQPSPVQYHAMPHSHYIHQQQMNQSANQFSSPPPPQQQQSQSFAPQYIQPYGPPFSAYGPPHVVSGPASVATVSGGALTAVPMDVHTGQMQILQQYIHTAQSPMGAPGYAQGRPMETNATVASPIMKPRPTNYVTPPLPNDERYNKQLIVNYIPASITNTDLYLMFTRFGELDGARVIRDRVTGNTKGYGFVYFRDAASAQRAVTEMNGYQVGGKWLKVGYSTNPLNIISQSNNNSDQISPNANNESIINNQEENTSESCA